MYIYNSCWTNQSTRPRVSITTRASNSICSDAMILPTGNWLFYLGGGTYYAILRFALSPIHSRMSAPSLYILTLWVCFDKFSTFYHF